MFLTSTNIARPIVFLRAYPDRTIICSGGNTLNARVGLLWSGILFFLKKEPKTLALRGFNSLELSCFSKKNQILVLGMGEAS
jgi:hypothetical protein